MVNVSIDTSDFNKTLKQFAVASEKPLAQVINRGMFDIIQDAYKLTPKADRSAIETALGATTVTRVSVKTGKSRNKVSYAPTTLAENIVQAKRHAAGLPALKRSDGSLLAAAKKLIASRLRAIGSLRAGWVRSIKTLATACGQSSQVEGPRVKLAGGARPAKDGWNPEASAEYDVTVVQPGAVAGQGPRQIDPRCIAALKGAYDIQQRVMEREISAVLNKVASGIK